MLRLLREKLLRVSTHGAGSSAALETIWLWSIHGNPLLKSISHSSESTPTDPTSSSLTISYLTTSCGLSPESALRTSKWFTLKNPKNADLVLDFLRNHSFDQTHIAKAMRRPQLLELHPEINLKPKMDFLTKYGFSDSQLVNILSRYPWFLSSSLDNQIAPHLEFLESLIETKEDVIASINRSTYLLRPFYQKRLASNVSTLRDLGVSVSKLIIKHPRTLCVAAPTRFREVVVAVHGMGFDPSTLEFVEAVQAMVRLSKSSWDGKVEVYNSLGWSKDEFLDAFRRKPACMMISEKKIRRGFEFFVKDLGWKPSSISKYPVFLCYNFEKRVIPRFSVLQVLLSKGLVEEIIWYSALKVSEKQFLERFVTKYKEEAPELMQAYQGAGCATTSTALSPSSSIDTQPDPAFHNTFIAIHSHFNHIYTALSVPHCMHDLGCPPSVPTAPSSRLHLPDLSLDLLGDIPSSDVYSYNTLLHCLFRSKRPSNALCLFNSMRIPLEQ